MKMTVCWEERGTAARKISPGPWAMAGIAVLMSCAFGGCHSSSNQARLDITTDVDAALSLKTVLLQVSGGKMAQRNFSPAPKLSWAVVVPDPKKGQLITVSAEGMNDNSTNTGTVTVVRYAVLVSIGPGETVPVHLKLTASCSPGPVCNSDENCDDGICKKRPTIGIADAGVDAMGTGGSDGGGGGPGGNVGTGGGAGGGGGGSTGATGGIVGTGGDAVAGMGGATTVPDGGSSSLPNGSACTTPGDCASTFCVDGLCCDKACTGCNACGQAATGKPDGTCSVVSSGLDPHNACADATATNQCGNDGMCDGNGGCRKVSTSHQCSPGSCAGTVFTPASNCDGAGACKTIATMDCGTFQCSATDGCKKSCAAPADCGSSSYCNTTTSTCAAKKGDGTVCAAALECASGFCIDGVCCHTDCTGCNACSAALTAQASGQCLPVSAGKSAHGACTASGTTCGLDGTCNGNGGCRSGARGTSCGSVCAGSTLSPQTCDGVGACATGTGSACGGSLICANTTTCKGSCAANSDCVTGNCTGTTCGAAKKATGLTCGAGTECVTGFCVDGTCCGTSSCAACKACNIAGSAGTCANKAANATDAACAATSTNCMTGTCNGMGGCTPASSSTSCGADVCTNGPESATAGLGHYTTPTFQRRLCDGGTAGAAGCKLGTNQGCGPNLTCASASACRPSCGKDADCVAGYFCNGNACAVLAQNGNPCTGHNQCLSRVCSVSGTCVACATDDDCPVGTPSCCGGLCSNAGICDDYYSNIDGSLNCGMQGMCGTRHSVCTGANCSCGGMECPNGSICKPGSPAKCLLNGGQPCVVSADCLSGTCGSDGTCALSALNGICDYSGASTRPSGCNSSTTCTPVEGSPTGVNAPPYNSVCL